MKYRSRQDVMDKLDWEGNEYAVTDMHPEHMPDEEMGQALEKLREAWDAFFELLP